MDLRTRLQRWLFLAAIGTTALLVALLFTVGIGGAQRGFDGETATFTASPFGLVYGLGLALIAVLLGWAIGLRRGAFWVFGGLLLGLGALVLATIVPVTFCQGATVSGTGFTCRVGFWFAPIEHRIAFGQTAALQVIARQGHGSPFPGRSYDLLCYLEPDGQTVTVPIGDLMAAALPEIFAAAGQHAVTILETADGWLIPPELSRRAQSPTARLRAAPGQLAILIGGLCALGAWAWWGNWRPAPEQHLTATEACYMLYCLAVVVLLVAFHGETGVPQGIGQGEPALRSLCLAVAATLAIAGGVVHLVQWRRGRADPMATQARWLGLVLLVGVVALADEKLGALRSGRWLVAALAGLFGVLFVAILAWVGVTRFRARWLPVNRMASRMRQGDFAAAIVIGEAIPPAPRDAGVCFNLAQSYRRTGRDAEARELLRELDTRTDLPEWLRTAVAGALQEVGLEAAVAGGPAVDPEAGVQA